MKYWRKMGNKLTIQEDNSSHTTLTGRQLKALTIQVPKSRGASKLLRALIKRI